jgi:hypothetical protein
MSESSGNEAPVTSTPGTADSDAADGSENTGTSTEGTGTGSESGSAAGGAGVMITDDQLPDDLNPEKNPLARAPGDEDGASGGDGASNAPDALAQAPGDPAAGDGPDLG